MRACVHACVHVHACMYVCISMYIYAAMHNYVYIEKVGTPTFKINGWGFVRILFVLQEFQVVGCHESELLLNSFY